MHNNVHVEKLFGTPNAINCSRSKFLVLSTPTWFLKPKIAYDQATFTQLTHLPYIQITTMKRTIVWNLNI
jgi:hypothetical protein